MSSPAQTTGLPPVLHELVVVRAAAATHPSGRQW